MGSGRRLGTVFLALVLATGCNPENERAAEPGSPIVGVVPASAEPAPTTAEPAPTTSPPPTSAAEASSPRIAFSSDRNGTTSIYLANGDGSGASLLTSGEAPAWSPDGARLAFHRVGSGIFVIDVSGANETFLGAGWDPSWSPDGAKIAFSTGSRAGGGIKVMNADGSAPRLLVSNEFASPGFGFDYCACSPAWSPSGGMIAFVRANYEDAFGIYTIASDGSGTPAELVGNGWFQDRPAWSPDGARILFEGGSPGGDVIASVSAGGGDFRVHATNPTGYIGSPAWSRQGAGILFSAASPRGAPTRIYVVRDDGSVTQIIPEAQDPYNPGYFDREPTWFRAN